MEIIKDTIEFNIEDETVVTIGKFDGIHNGHVLILDRMKQYRARGLKICVMTFDRTPAMLGFGKDKKVLMTMAEKEKVFDALGIDYLVEFPFYEKTAAIDARTFIEDFVVERMNARAVVVGTDCSFGQGAKGNAQMLRDFGPIYDYEVEIMEKLMDGEREISSTYLRELLQEGNVSKMSEISCRPVNFRGILKQGPSEISPFLTTYYMTIPDEKVMPKPGVYYSIVLYDDSPYSALTDVPADGRVCESYLYNDIKGITCQETTLCLVGRMRDSIDFESADILNTRVREDIFEGQKWHKENFAKIAQQFDRVEC